MKRFISKNIRPLTSFKKTYVRPFSSTNFVDAEEDDYLARMAFLHSVSDPTAKLHPEFSDKKTQDQEKTKVSEHVSSLENNMMDDLTISSYQHAMCTFKS